MHTNFLTNLFLWFSQKHISNNEHFIDITQYNVSELLEICDAIKQNESELEQNKNTDFCSIVIFISRAILC